MDGFKRVKVEFAIKDIPNVGSRSFIDTLHFQPSHDVIFLQDAVRNKLQVLGCEGCDFEILMGEYYVDNSYFDELIEELFATPIRKQQPVASTTNINGGVGMLLGIGGKSQQQQQGDGGNNDNSSNSVSAPLKWKFDVTVKAKRLTKDVLQRMMQQGSSGGMVDRHNNNNNSPTTMTTSYPIPPPTVQVVEAVPIGSLSYTLTRGKYRVEGRVRSVRKKTATISEVELVDLHLQHNVITVIAFSQICSDRLAALKPNTCYEFKNIQCAQKNARDQQYSSNGHTMKIIADDSSEIRPISDPVTNYASDQITTVIGGKTSRDVGGIHGYVPGAMATPFPTITLLSRNNNNSGDLLDTSSSSAAYTASDRAPLTSTASSSSLGGRGFLGSSQNGGVMGRPPQPRTTLLQRPPSSIATGSTATSGMRSGTTTTLLRPAATAHPASPTTTTAHHQQIEEPSPITSRDTQLLLEIAAEEAEAEELKRRRTEANPQCILCGHNLASEADRKEVQRRKEIWCKLPTASDPLVYEDLRAEMRDKRSQIPGYKSEQYRMYCRAQFRHPLTKELHKVHCRCAHLAFDYQSGSDMATTVLNASMAECSLCGEMGATVACLHPDCKKRYHTLCAVLSNGHVDFDQRDPYLPKPACPTHTNPGVKRRRPVLLRWDGDAMDTSAGTAAFDSAIVNRYDLRDPDDDSRA